MKKLFKSAIALVVVLAMAISTGAASVLAAERSSVEVLADFSNFDMSDLKAVNNHLPETYVSANSYEEGNSSVRIVLNQGANVGIDIANNNFAEYLATYPDAMIKVRYTGDGVGDKFNVVWAMDGTGINSTNGYIKKVAETNGKWNTSGIMLKDIVNYTKNNVAKFDDAKITLAICPGGYGLVQNVDYNTTHSVYIDKVWLEANTAVEIAKNGEDDAIYTLATYNNGVISGGSTHVFVKGDNSRDGGNAAYCSVEFTDAETAAGDFAGTHYITQAIPSNYKDYGYLNMWVYSPRAQGMGFSLNALNANGTQSKKVLNDETKTLDWEGWKLISYPISGINDWGRLRIDLAKNAASLDGDASWGGTQKRWIGTETEPSGIATAAANANIATTAASFGIESVWLSKNQPANANTVVLGSDEAASAIAEGDVVVADYGRNDSITGTNVNVTTENARMYSKAARSNLFNGVLLRVGKGSNVGQFKNQKNMSGYSYQDKTNADMYLYKASGTDYLNAKASDYLNIWIYNPQEQLDQQGNYSEYILALEVYTDATTKKNKTAGIVANFEGWKRISIPFFELDANWNESYGISSIRICTHAWPDINKNTTDRTTLTKVHSEDSLAKSYNTDGKYNTWPQYTNWFDVERVWISAESPSTTFAVEPAENTVGVDVTKKSFVFNTSKIGKVSDEAVKVIKITGEEHSVVEDVTMTVGTDTITVTFAEDLTYGSIYRLYLPEMYDTNGTVIDNERTQEISTKAYDMSEIIVSEDGLSGEVTIQGTMPEKYSNAVLIGAVYNGNQLVKAQIGTYDAEANKFICNIGTPEEAFDETSFFFWEGLDTLVPILTPNGKDMQ